MSKRTISLFLIFCSLYVMVLAQPDEKIVLTTYYPSPAGSYRSLQVYRLGVGDNNTDGRLTIADVPSTDGHVWVRGRVGIGTNDPQHPIHVGDGAYCTGTLWVAASDIAYKKNVTNLKYGLNEVLKLQPREFDMKQDNSHQIGFIAQEIEKIIPEVVSGKDGKKGISYGNLAAVLVKAIQEQQKEIEKLKLELRDLRAQLNIGQ